MRAQSVLQHCAPAKRQSVSFLCVVQDDFNKECWGEDAAGNRYWLHDLGDGRGLRLCREGPLGIAPAPAKCARGDAPRGGWETIACSIDEIAEVRRVAFTIRAVKV